MQNLNKELLQANIEKAAQYDFDNQKVFGSAYFVMQEDAVVCEKCFGTTSPHSTEPVTNRTIFRLASMTKPITAIAALILVDRGLLSLSDKVVDYLPEFKDIHITQITQTGELVDLGKAKNDITVLHLLTHSSGIGSIAMSKSAKMTDEDKKSVDNTVKFFAKIGLDYEPGTKQYYSGIAAFDVLVKIMEGITQTDYLTFLQQEIFEPCDMVDTTFIPTEAQWGRIIAMHNRVDGKSVVGTVKENCVHRDYPCTHFLGGGGLISTLSDYAKFATMLLHSGKTPKKQLVREDTFQLLHTSHAPMRTDPNQHWGLGMRVVTGEGYERLPVGAYGWSGAYGSHFWLDPANKLVAIFMKNSQVDGGSRNESGRNFEQAVHDSFDHT